MVFILDLNEVNVKGECLNSDFNTNYSFFNLHIICRKPNL